jgi:hypothetical protein
MQWHSFHHNFRLSSQQNVEFIWIQAAVQNCNAYYNQTLVLKHEAVQQIFPLLDAKPVFNACYKQHITLKYEAV